MSDQQNGAPSEGQILSPSPGSAWAQMSPLLVEDQAVGADAFAPETYAFGADTEADLTPSFEALADQSALPVTVYPFLRQVSDRMAKHIALELRKKSGALVDVAVVDQVNMRMGNVTASIPLPSLIGVITPDAHDGTVFVVIDGAMAALYFDMLFGGADIKSSIIMPVRNFSVIEIKLFQTLVDSFVHASNAAFAPLIPISLKTDRVETNPRFLPNAKAQDSVIKIRFLVQCGARSGFMDCYLSARFLTPIDARLRPSVDINMPISDPQWQNHLRKELLKSHVELRANLSDIEIPLYRLRNLKPGDVLPLDKGPDSLIELIIDGRSWARGRMGRSTGKIAIRVEERLLQSEP